MLINNPPILPKTGIFSAPNVIGVFTVPRTDGSTTPIVTLTTKTYRLLVDYWTNCYRLDRSRFQGIESVKYIDENDVEQVVSSDDYYNTVETFYSRLIFKDSFNYPTTNNQLQSVYIDFKVGFGDSEADIPEDIKIGLMQHVVNIIENKGDCVDSSCSNIVPKQTELVYKQYTY